MGSIALEAFERGPSRGVLSDFLARRWMRTLPNYYLFLAVNAGLAVWLGGPGFQARYVVFMQNLCWPMARFFGESWSLAVEEVFYLALPILLALVNRHTPSPARVLRALCVALVTIPLLRLAYVAALHPPFHEGILKTAALRLDSIGYGVVAAWLNRYAQPLFLTRRWVSLAAGVALIIASVRGVRVLAPASPLAASAVLCGVSLGAALTLPFLSTWRTAPAPVCAAFEWTSRISYALYLCHLPTSRVLAFFGLERGVSGLLLWLGASCLVATVVHYGVERPFLRLRERRRGPTVPETETADRQAA